MKIRCLYIILLFFPGLILAQDARFSQFYWSPLSLNPAFTGDIEGNIRGILYNRNQWYTVSDPYITSLISIDTRLFENLLSGNAIGAGIIAIHDKAGVVPFTNLQVLANISFQKKFGKEKSQVIALGVQSGFFQKKTDITQLTFSSQFHNEDFDTGIPSGENTIENTITNFDLSAGVVCKLQRPSGTKMNGGISFFHLNRPEQSLLGNNNRLSIRSVAHCFIEFPLVEKTRMSGELLYMEQCGARELNIGGKLIFDLVTSTKKKADLIVGVGWRKSDAIILCGGLKYGNIECLLSYDINVSKLHVASNYQGAYEISIRFVDKWLSGYNKVSKKVPCIRL